jgi:hypothetical protein
VALLTTESLGFSDRDPLQSNLLQRLLHFIELERFNDRLDFLHRVPSPGSRTCRIHPGTDPWLADCVPMPLVPKIAMTISVLCGERSMAMGSIERVWSKN